MSSKPNICLNMIVRDEAHVIRETLDSVSKYIDYWVIVDTGSEDETPGIIKDYFAANGIDGELHFREWRNFGHNRTEALKLCKGKSEYAWVIDADDLVVGQFDLDDLSEDSYSLKFGPDFCYWRKQIFRTSLDWHYVGVVHEYAECIGPVSHSRLDGDYHIVSRRLGARNRNSKKYARDIELLTREVSKNPDDARSAFYLAQSYYDNNELEQALHWYRKRVLLKGWEEEVYYSKLRIAQCMEILGSSFADISASYLESWETRPARAEPLYHLSRLCREHKHYNSGYLYAMAGTRIPFPEEEQLFVDAGVYRWRLLDELAIHAYYTGRYEESSTLLEGLLTSEMVPPNHLERLEKNRQFAHEKLAQDYVEIKDL